MYTTKCIQMYAFSFLITSLSCITFFIIRSGGNVLMLSSIESAYIWFIQLPLCYLLIKFTSLEIPVIYLIVLLSLIIKVFIGLILIKKRTWLNKLV